MTTRKILLMLIIGLLLPVFTSAQIKYGISVYGGASNIKINNNDRTISAADDLHPSSHFTFEGFIVEFNKKSRFSFEQGISFETSGVENWIGDEIYQYYLERGVIYSKYYTYRTYQLCIPLRVKYNFKEYLAFHAGVSNVFYLKKQENYVNNTYALRGELGADVTIAERYIIGIKGSYDITPCGQYLHHDIFMHYYSLSLKAGILLSSFKKEKN